MRQIMLEPAANIRISIARRTTPTTIQSDVLKKSGEIAT
jgi:hypothetical protein